MYKIHNIVAFLILVVFVLAVVDTIRGNAHTIFLFCVWLFSLTAGVVLKEIIDNKQERKVLVLLLVLISIAITLSTLLSLEYAAIRD